MDSDDPRLRRFLVGGGRNCGRVVYAVIRVENFWVILDPQGEFPPLYVTEGGMKRWACGCFVASGWQMGGSEPGAIVAGCDAHARAMRAAHNAYAQALDHPAEHSDWRDKLAIDIILAMVDAEDGHP